MTSGDCAGLGDSLGVSRTPQPGARPWATLISDVLGIHCLLKPSQVHCEASTLFSVHLIGMEAEALRGQGLTQVAGGRAGI